VNEADLYDAPTAIPEPAAFDLVFVTWGAITWLPDIARYLKGIELRLSKLEAQPQRDRERLLKLDEVLAEYEDYRSSLRPGAPGWDVVQQVRWMIEELRISTFAQELGTG
jgi:ATP-dependent helicase HrpA